MCECMRAFEYPYVNNKSTTVQLIRMFLLMYDLKITILR